MATIQSFEEITAWKKAHELALNIYKITDKLQFSKDFGLKDQIRRAAVSVPSNIAEGFERDGNREFIQFLSYSKASVGELKSQLYLARDLNYIDRNEFNEIIIKVNESSKLIGAFMNYLKRTEIRGKKFQDSNTQKIKGQT